MPGGDGAQVCSVLSGSYDDGAAERNRSTELDGGTRLESMVVSVSQTFL